MLRTVTLVLLAWLSLLVCASPTPDSFVARLQRRTDPYFPDQPESCPICAKDYDSIRNCAEAAPVLQNFTMVLFNPGAVIDVIQCACAETFTAVFPQCVDCFIRTGQEHILAGNDLPSVVQGIRRVCAISSTLLGNVTQSNDEPPPSPAPTSSSTTQAISLSTLLVTSGVSLLAASIGFGIA
ncbi:hypothetical protein BKA70DRAFT_1266465 [Coprinopsis sp. MPI-PUGE-AT-0042]|nr:hypothetical protein BKA70DRAFT_1266465 [Coprinopsis sp. MPI-PUGE-AT-0042]